jgi:hypothetical protein
MELKNKFFKVKYTEDHVEIYKLEDIKMFSIMPKEKTENHNKYDLVILFRDNFLRIGEAITYKSAAEKFNKILNENGIESLF